ncbi:hypothetical protein, partial [Peribacillus frigoritolerans]|uniref:hypothetical protein n=1 Tax=Peribacillus frigoritolerans TaxID=450367 RepID=UPI00227F2C6B
MKSPLLHDRYIFVSCSHELFNSSLDRISQLLELISLQVDLSVNSRHSSLKLKNIAIQKRPAGWLVFSNGLAASYSHRGKPPTTIGAEELNCRVR